MSIKAERIIINALLHVEVKSLSGFFFVGFVNITHPSAESEPGRRAESCSLTEDEEGM